MRTMSTPVEHTVAEASDVKTAPARSAPVTRSVAAAPAAAKAAPVTAKSLPAETQPVAPAPVEAPAPVSAAPASIAAPAPVAKTTQTTRQQSIDSEALPIAGILGLGVLAVGGAAFALRRKRREDDEEEFQLEREALAEPAAAPAAVAPVAIAPRATAATPAPAPKILPGGMDISKFGRHAQAAYMGPTPDNPSLSLMRRLKRASFFDQREREAAAAGGTQTLAEPVYPAVAKAAKDNGQVTIRLTPQHVGSRNGYVLQK